MPNTKQAQASLGHDEIPLRPVTLRDVLIDCGGPAAVAEKLSLALTTVYDWSRKGRVPDSDLREAGGTDYSETIASMQKTMQLTPSAIRRLGRRI
ncbi:helix-turn-helix domain-containing protein [Billgrantia pellis]|uniref:Helix-turn-helix domain-containing protein n=1 Tax=Billgrantia pellis TaxID=2606936 RepID=A0A7V7G439_9GAMM|nr:helix-turn-helix domain-containing protein [Halomonas pellis]KAA0014407.1 helix-turn-helix domain-containing protein [Halomonas pellis]